MSHPYLAYFDQDDLPINPNLTFDYIEQHLSEVTSFWATGKLEELVQHVKKLLDLNIYDIRLLIFYFYSLWASDKYDCSLEQVLTAFQQLLKQPPQVWLLPEEDKKDEKNAAPSKAVTLNTALNESTKQQLQSYLTLFFSRIEQRLARFANQPDYEEKQPCRIIHSAHQFAKLLEQKYQLTDIVPLVKKINPYFDDACEQETIAAENSMNNEITDAITDKITNDVKTSSEHPESEKSNVGEPAPPHPTGHYSLALQQLLNKLQIFETLMQENNSYKAAIVFESIQKELQHFNPLHYLPELFSDYAKTHAVYAVELNQLIQQHDGIQSQALKDYFAMDPSGFLQLEIEVSPTAQHSDRMDNYHQSNKASRFDDESDDFQ